ncbi:hypothetical protein SEVIR_4G123850v4 [Setaria viridis]
MACSRKAACRAYRSRWLASICIQQYKGKTLPVLLQHKTESSCVCSRGPRR